MGYPMTWKRVTNRNGIADGDYTQAPMRHRKRVATDARSGSSLGEKETKLARFDSIAERVNEYENAFKLLAGDLRRLELDAQDERSLCLDIERRTGIKREIVATVLKEFFSL